MPKKKSQTDPPELVEGQRPLAELCCVYEACADAGLVGGGNLAHRRGKGAGRWRILYCRRSKVEFSERKGTALWNARMDPTKAAAIARHLAEGCGIRKTARLVGASKDGETSIAIRSGLHAKRFPDREVRELEVHEAQ